MKTDRRMFLRVKVVRGQLPQNFKNDPDSIIPLLQQQYADYRRSPKNSLRVSIRKILGQIQKEEGYDSTDSEESMDNKRTNYNLLNRNLKKTYSATSSPQQNHGTNSTPSSSSKKRTLDNTMEGNNNNNNNNNNAPESKNRKKKRKVENVLKKAVASALAEERS